MEVENITLRTENKTLKEQVNELQAQFDNFILKIYPVGCIYMSIQNTSPNTLFGGEWEPWGTGKTLVGVDITDIDFDIPEKTGGEKAHTLTISEMPSHEHAIAMYDKNWISNYEIPVNNVVYGVYGTDGIRYAKTDNGNGTAAVQGGNKSHNNLQPYITCYMWKRVS